MSEGIVYRREGFPGQGSPPAPDSAFQIAERLLAATLTEFRQADLDVPDRQVIYFSPIPVDCEQLAVLVAQWTPTPGWEGFQQCSTYEWMLTVSVAICRATPAMAAPGRGNRASLPTAGSMTEAFRIASQDMDVLRNVMAGAGPVGAESAIIPGAPSGGFQSVELRLQIPGIGL